jgi:DNA topoisomerase-1
MEEKFDLIAIGKENWIEFLEKFYYPFEETVQKGINEAKNGDKITIPSDPTGVFCEKGLELVKRGKKNNKFLGCSDWPDCETLLNLPLPENVNYDKYDNPVKCGSKPTVQKNNSLAEKSGVMCPGNNELLIRKRKRDQNKFLGCSKYPKCKVTMPLPPESNSGVKQQKSWESSRVKEMKKCSELKVSGNGTSNIK